MEAMIGFSGTRVDDMVQMERAHWRERKKAEGRSTSVAAFIVLIGDMSHKPSPYPCLLCKARKRGNSMHSFQFGGVNVVWILVH
jgi:hypothetical protein